MERSLTLRPSLAVIPARGGSKGLPGKNTRLLADVPLLAHSALCARLSVSIDRIIVSTDDSHIRDVATSWGIEVPFLRPPNLASDTAAMWPVLQHALAEMERVDGKKYQSVVLLDPTSPGRLPEDIDGALNRLAGDDQCDGVVGVSEPEFNPLWHCVVEDDGYMRDLVPDAGMYERRQDVPQVYRINASIYCWRRQFVFTAADWRQGRLRMFEIPEARSVHIDSAEQFQLTELRLRNGLLRFPWLDNVNNS